MFLLLVATTRLLLILIIILIVLIILIILIIILVLMVLPTFISIALYRFGFIISNAVAGLLGCEREGRILIEISSIYGYVLAIISISAVALLLLITVFAKCASPLT